MLSFILNENNLFRRAAWCWKNPTAIVNTENNKFFNTR